jgi:hypothetical protein
MTPLFLKGIRMTLHPGDHQRLINLAAAAVRSHGIDADEINSDSIDDRVHPDVFAEALDMASMDAYEAAEISDALHEGISIEYWRLVDEANGID